MKCYFFEGNPVLYRVAFKIVLLIIQKERGNDSPDRSPGSARRSRASAWAVRSALAAIAPRYAGRRRSARLSRVAAKGVWGRMSPSPHAVEKHPLGLS